MRDPAAETLAQHEALRRIITRCEHLADELDARGGSSMRLRHAATPSLELRAAIVALREHLSTEERHLRSTRVIADDIVCASRRRR